MKKKNLTNTKKVLSPSLKSYFFKCINDAVKILGFTDYDTTIHWMSEDEEQDNQGPCKVRASILVDKRYLTARIRVYPVLIAEWKDKKNGKENIRATLFHEVSHIATQHFMDVAVAAYRDEGEMKDAWETCTERIAQLALRVDYHLTK